MFYVINFIGLLASLVQKQFHVFTSRLQIKHNYIVFYRLQPYLPISFIDWIFSKNCKKIDLFSTFLDLVSIVLNLTGNKAAGQLLDWWSLESMLYKILLIKSVFYFYFSSCLVLYYWQAGLFAGFKKRKKIFFLKPANNTVRIYD